MIFLYHCGCTAEHGPSALDRVHKCYARDIMRTMKPRGQGAHKDQRFWFEGEIPEYEIYLPNLHHPTTRPKPLILLAVCYAPLL